MARSIRTAVVLTKVVLKEKGEYPDMWLILVHGIQDRCVIARK